MEAAGGVARTVAFCADAPRDLRRESRSKGRARSSSLSMCPRRGFADEGHLRYYASKVSCGEVQKEEKKAIKGRMKLLKGSTALELVDGFLSVALVPGEIEERRMTITDAADALLAQLELLRAQEKQMKKKKLEKKAAKQMKACEDSEDSGDEEESMTAAVLVRKGKDCHECKDSDHGEIEKKEEKKKAARAKEAAAKQRMKDCCESEDSSSSSSSESSDSDCEGECVDMNDLRTVPPVEEEPAVGDAQMEAPPMGAINSAIAGGSIVEERAERDDASKPPAVHIQCSSGIGNSLGSNTGICDSSSSSSVVTGVVDSSIITCCSSSSSGVTGGDKPVNMGRIEVCMGGKCRKSGGMELMQEFERRVGSEGVVVGCKCMGKCREGPNVRLRGLPAGDESGGIRAVPARSPPLCIGVGLEDVGTLLANFFAAEKEDVGLLAA